MRALLLALLLAAPALRAQEEPTPFWMPAPEPAKKPAKPARPGKKEKPKPVQVEPLEIKPKPPPAKQRPPQVTKKRRDPGEPEEVPVERKPAGGTPAKKQVEKRPAPYEPTWIEPPEREPAPAPRKPSATSKKKRAPVEPETPPAASRKPVTPAPPEPSGEPARVLASPAPQPEPVAVVEGPSAPAGDLPRWSFQLVGGAWAKSRSDGGGRSFDPAYGLRAGRALFDGRVEVDLALLRSGGSAGSPYVSTSTTHNLGILRAFYVLGGPRLSLLAGAGGGAVLAQSHYSLQDVNGGTGTTPTGLDAAAPRTVMAVTAAGRLRPVRGLEVRLEVSGLVRDGRFEWLPLLGLGAAF